jgi:hypothetical protein
MAISTTYSPNAPAARSGQGSAIGNREDLSNELCLLAPEDTPILSLCSKGKANSTFREWNTDKLGAISTAGISENTDVTAFEDKFASRARLGNYTQIFRKSWMVSTIQDAVTSAAPANSAAAEAKAIRELKRNMEATICSSNEMTVENGGGVPYGLRGLGKWLQSTAQATNPVPADYLTPAGSILTAAPSESTLNNVIASIFSKNGEMNALTVVADIAVRKVISEFTRTSTNTNTKTYQVNQDVTSKKITLSVTMFDSDFGQLSIVNGNPDCMPSGSNAYIINPKYLGFDTLIPMGSQRLENQGGGERGFIEAVGTLLVKHPQAHGKIAY